MYHEKDPIRIPVPDTDYRITLSVECLNGTVANVSFPPGSNCGCGGTERIGIGVALKGKTVRFTGGGNNPGGGPFRVRHVFKEEGAVIGTYTFPDDYNGTPPFDPADQHPDYTFKVHFI